jgi:hypothetical protein
MIKLPRYPQFKTVELSDLDCLAKYFKKYPAEGCEMIFGNIFAWRRFDRPKYTTINHNLCILCEPPTEPAYFLQPIGDNDLKDAIQTCLGFAPRLSRIPEHFAKKYCGGYKLEPDRNNFDYIYLTEDLINLKGKKFDGKRNRIKKFTRHHEYQYVKLAAEHLPACRKLFAHWMTGKTFAEWIEKVQKDALSETLENFRELGLVGGAIEVNGKLEAFSIGEELNPETAVIHFEIADPKYIGLAQLMNQEFIKQEWLGYKFINREQDLGLPGLRNAKLSYHPDHLVTKYHVSID